MGDVDDTLAKQLGSSTAFLVIQILASQEEISFIHPEVIDDSTKKLVDEMVSEGPTRSSAPSSDFIKQWLQHMQHDRESGPSTSALLLEEELKALYGE